MLIKTTSYYKATVYLNPDHIVFAERARVADDCFIVQLTQKAIVYTVQEWERIEPMIAGQQPPDVAELEERIAELESELETAGILMVSDEEFEELEERVFLRDIGFDPDNLPSSVGERADIKRALFGSL